MTAPPPTWVVLDLDGVIRHVDIDTLSEAARSDGVDVGDLMIELRSEERMRRLITGAISRSDWALEIASALGDADAITWSHHLGTVDRDMVGVIDRLRGRGVPVALLTNGTDNTSDELRRLDLDHRLDRVFNSAEMGVAKPDPEIYHRVQHSLGVEPGAVYFVDDRAENVEAARAEGWRADVFIDAATLEAELRSLLS